MRAEETTQAVSGTSPGGVLCVDLEAALTRGNIVWEAWFALLRQRPDRAICALIPSVLRRHVAFQDYVAAAVQIDARDLPYDEELLERLRRARAAGRKLVLITALPRRWAEAISGHLDLFEAVITSNAGGSETEATLSRVLRERFGVSGFDYVGTPDCDVWSIARSGWVVAAGAHAAARAGRIGHAEAVIVRRTARWRDWLKQVRLHQWLKNLLVFIPLVAARRFRDQAMVEATIAAFVAFGCAASANYILNDLLDLYHDRHHPRKRRRPLAAGLVSIRASMLVMAALFSAGAAIAWFLPVTFAEVLLLYLAGTLAYSLGLKRRAPIDTFTLAGLYTLRVFAGNAATRLPPSFWLLAFSIFLFLSLAMAKRYAELLHAGVKGHEAPRGRGYLAVDREMVSQLGVGAGYISVLVLALYLNSPQAASLYSRPGVLWLFCLLLLYWVTRLWLVAHRGQLDDDPVVFAIRDRQSRYTAIAAAVLLWLAR